LRRELDLPTRFPLAAQREADEAASRVLSGLTTAGLSTPGVTTAGPTTAGPTTAGPTTAGSTTRAAALANGTVDRTDIALVTIDPATSRDLDQAVGLVKVSGGFRIHYAIADVTAFVPLAGELEAETWRRGQTVYLPDGKVPLHPVSLSEGAGSLLPGEARPAALWTIDLDEDGGTIAVRLERAVVRSRAKLNYPSVQAAVAAGTLDDSIALLPRVGALLTARALRRGAINLPIPEQEIEPDDDGWRLVLRPGLPVEEWNAQISLLTGMCAADIMLAGGVGLLRTMPAPRPEAIGILRTAASGLGIEWPDGVGVGTVLAAIEPGSPRGAAFVDQAAELMRGAGYTAFDGPAPGDPGHGAVAAPYAHVTAPLRRLADRYATEVCLSLHGGHEVPDWVREALPRLPEVMTTTDRRASAAERGALDLAEAVILAGRVGEEFDAVVIDVNVPRQRRAPQDAEADGERQRAPGGTVAIDSPPVRARCDGALPLGERVRVRLVKADPSRRSVAFELVG
jgi:exoribonuclease R